MAAAYGARCCHPTVHTGGEMTRSTNENGQTIYRLPQSKLLTADVMSTRRTAAAGKRSRASHAGPRRTSSKWRRLYKAAAPRTFQPRIADARCRVSPAGARSGAPRAGAAAAATADRTRVQGRWNTAGSESLSRSRLILCRKAATCASLGQSAVRSGTSGVLASARSRWAAIRPQGSPQFESPVSSGQPTAAAAVAT
jgi:hypothetical protein